MSNEIRLAIAGVGNCASSLMQGIEYYRDADPTRPCRASCTSSSAATTCATSNSSPPSTSTPTRSARTWARPSSPVRTTRFASPRCGDSASPWSAGRPSTVSASTTARRSKSRRPLRSTCRHAARSGRRSARLLPAGGFRGGPEATTRPGCLEAGVAFVNAIPVFIASDPVWAKRFTRRRCADHRRRHQEPGRRDHRPPDPRPAVRGPGPVLDRTYQLNVGGNMDFKNMLERDRLESKKISKTQAVTSQIDHAIAADDVHIGPSDHVAWLRTGSGPTSDSRVETSATCH